MKCRKSKFSINNVFAGQLKSLNLNEMVGLRGGGQPPLPPSPGEDFPIDFSSSSMMQIQTANQKTVSVPVKLPLAAVSNAAVIFK